jgi:hypothetical protein
MMTIITKKINSINFLIIKMNKIFNLKIIPASILNYNIKARVIIYLNEKIL